MVKLIGEGQYTQLMEAKGIIVKSTDELEKQKIAVMFPGHGAQYPSMLLKLRESYDAVRKIMDTSDILFQSLAGKPLTKNWAEDITNEAVVLQPSIYTANLAMYSLLKQENISADFFVGHSLGEISALATAGTINYEEGLRICYYRAKSLDKLLPEESGKMLSIKGNPEENYLIDFLDNNKNSCVSIVNNHNQFVVSGYTEEIMKLKQICEEQKITSHILPIPFPFHSPLLKNVSEEFYDNIKSINFVTNKIPVYSNILQRFYVPDDFHDSNIARILASQLFTPFSFVKSINDIYDKGARVFLECGPNNILSALVNDIIMDRNKVVMYMNAKREDEKLTIEKFKAKAALNIAHGNEGGQSGMKLNWYTAISKFTGYPIDIIEKYTEQYKNLDLAKKLAINSTKEKEILTYMEAEFSIYSENGLNSIFSDSAPSVNSCKREDVSLEEVIGFIKKAIAEKTGYPVELLENEADLEADLGIDSVKQAEVLGIVREHYGYEKDTNVKIKDYPDILSISNYIINKINNCNEEEPDNNSLKAENTVIKSYDEVVSIIKDTISEKTGYPVELLENEADLEADLGIDSVKQAEILGKIREYFGYEVDTNAKIKEFPNIRLISENVLSRLDQNNNDEKKKNEILMLPFADNHLNYVTSRYSATAVLADLSNELPYSMNEKRILVIGESSGEITKRIISLLQDNNMVAAIGSNKNEEFYTDFLDSRQLINALENATMKLGEVDCIINLQALGEDRNLNDYSSSEEFEKAYKSIYNGLFYSSKICYKFLESNKNAAYFAVTSIGDYFGVEHKKLHGSLGAVTTGFIKALEKELRPFTVKVIDVEKHDDDELCKLLIGEFSHFGNYVEIGYVNGIRKCIITVKDDKLNMETENSGTMKLYGDSILVTGGGRGITFECAEAFLSRIDKPIRVYLTGRTAIPSGTEEWLNMSEMEFNNYKTKFMLEQKREHPNYNGIEIVEEYEKLKNARKLQENLNKLRKEGHLVDYIICDFSKEEDVKKLYLIIKNNNSDLMGIINGAGLPSFGKIPRKNEEAAYKVLQLKANSMYFINKYFMNQNIGFVISMGSISGRFGMDGQVDYSAAADLLVKLTKNISEDYEGCKFICIGWPAWDSVGMAASEEVMKVQKEVRGLSYISVEEGRAQFLKELLSNFSSKCEYLYFGELGELNMPLGQLDNLRGKQDKDWFIDRLISCGENYISVERKLDKKNDMHLEQHKVDGHSVLAGVYHIELACEVFKLFSRLNHKDDYTISTVSNFSFYEFIKYFEGNPLTMKAYGEIIDETDNQLTVKVQIKSDFVNKQGMVLRKDRVHSEGIIIGRKEPSKNNTLQDVNYKYETVIQTEGMKSLDLKKYYEISEKLIYFGEEFRNIRNVEISEYQDCIIGEVIVTDEGLVFGSREKYGSFGINPIVVDNIGRLMLLNEFDKYGYSIVPTHIESAQKFRDFIIGEILHVNCIKISEQDNKVTYDANAYDKNNEIVFIIKNMTLTRIGKLEGDYNIKNQ
ncbi:MAG: SDR family NAD(P)-dependent oxidoreductase [Anaerocolumna sp.]